MRRILLVAIGLLLCCSSSVFGCGDKFLIIGRGADYRHRYVAIHPARILLFGKKAAGDADVDVKHILQRAGHKVDYVADDAQLEGTMRAASYDFVITPIESVRSVETRVHSLAPQTLVVPILFASNEQEIRNAEREYECIAKTTEKQRSFLTVLDDAMTARLRGDRINCKWATE